MLIVLVIALLPASKADAVSGINQQVNYQARLLNSTGATVPDGTYNMRFKIYCDGDGILGGTDPGTCSDHATAEHILWTETRTAGDKVTVTNGYFNVQLGSVTAFGSSVDWNQSKLWLSVDIGGTGTPTWDGEMSPFRRLSASPYALNAGQLGGRSAAEFLQLAPSAAQIDSSTASSVFVNKTGATGNILQLQKAGNNVFSVSNSGTVSLASDNVLSFKTGTTDNIIRYVSASNLLQMANSSTNGILQFQADSFQLQDTTGFNTNLEMLNTGAVKFKNRVDSTTAFQVQNASAAPILNVDTTNKRLGIGTATPNYAIQIDQGTATAGTLQFTAGTTTGTTNADGFTVGIDVNGSGYIINFENNPIFFATNALNRMKISAAGNVSIGDLEPVNALQIDKGTATGSLLQFTANTTTGRTTADGMAFGITAAGAGQVWNYENTAINFATNNTTRLIIDAGGGILLGASGTPGQELEVNGDIRLDTTGTATLFGLCHSGADVDTTFTNRDIVACSGVQSGVNDYAEFYPTEADVSYGDVVMISDTLTETYAFKPDGTADKTKKVTVSSLTKATKTGRSKLVGVVSNNYTDFHSIGRAVLEDKHHPLPIALNGRVPVKVSTENGDIAAGDPLTASSTPGVAMKATEPGMVIGRALAPYKNEGVGQTMVFLSNYFYTPPASGTQGGTKQAIQTSEDTSLSNLNVSGNTVLNTLTVKGKTTFDDVLVVKELGIKDNLVLEGHLITRGQAPTITSLARAGTGAQVSVSGNDTTGVITIMTGASPSGGELAKITFHKAFQDKPHVLLTPVGRESADLNAYIDRPAATEFMIGAGRTPEAKQTYHFNYHVLQ